MREPVAPVGGQAVIEGVMMRSKPGYAVGLLRKSGKVDVVWFDAVSFARRHPVFAKPFLRGMTALFESMVIGVRALMFSASEQEIEENDEKQVRARDKAKKKAEKLQMSGFATGLMVVFSLVFGLGLFVALPNIIIELLGIKEVDEPFLFNMVSGLTRIVMFVAYIALISLMKDIRRVFQFHGAEHKAVNCHEAGQKVTLANAKKFTTLHPRCGTSFMFFVLLVAILLFAFVPLALNAAWPWFRELAGGVTLDIVVQKSIIIGLHILLLPIVSGIAYEFIRLSWKFRSHAVCRVLMAPGLALQKLTTKEPEDSQVKVAVMALNEALRRQEAAPGPAGQVGPSENGKKRQPASVRPVKREAGSAGRGTRSRDVAGSGTGGRRKTEKPGDAVSRPKSTRRAGQGKA